MTATKSKTAKKLTVVPTENVPVNGLIFAFNENTLRAVSIYAAANMFSQPQFASQTNPSNILGLADLMFRYIQGQVNVSQPTEAAPVESAKFG